MSLDDTSRDIRERAVREAAERKPSRRALIQDRVFVRYLTLMGWVTDQVPKEEKGC